MGIGWANKKRRNRKFKKEIKNNPLTFYRQ